MENPAQKAGLQFNPQFYSGMSRALGYFFIFKKTVLAEKLQTIETISNATKTIWTAYLGSLVWEK